MRSRRQNFLFSGALLAVALTVIKVASMIVISNAIGIISPQSFKCSAEGSGVTIHVRVAHSTADGSSDDSAAIQDAIDAAVRRGGGVVALSPARL